MNQQWQPIESYPDSIDEGYDYVLGWDGETVDVMERFICEDGSKVWAIANASDDDPPDKIIYRLFPTHWMPLPEPPQENNMNEDEALDDMLNGVSDGESRPTFEDYAELVRQWASDRQIIQNSTATAQLEKLDEERQETIEAIYQYMFREELSNDPAKAWDEVVDGFGDQLVCLINAAAIAGVDLTDALAHAYDQIKDRTGRLRSDGIFEKDEPS